MKTKICEGTKFYKKLKAIIYFKITTYLTTLKVQCTYWFFKKFNVFTLKVQCVCVKNLSYFLVFQKTYTCLT